MTRRAAGALARCAPLLPVAACPALWILQRSGRLAFRHAFLLELAYAGLAALLLVLQQRGGAPRSGAPRGFLPLLAGVALLGLLARTVVAPEFPPDDELWEEVQTMRVAVDSLARQSLDPWFPVTDLAAEVGIRTGGVSLASARRPFVALSVLSVPLFAVAARLAFGSLWPVAWAGVLFASLAILAAGGRIALETHSGVFTLALSLAATAWAARRRDPGAAAVAGIAAGLVTLEYDSYRPFGVLCGIWLLFACAEDRGSAGVPLRYSAAALRRHWAVPLFFAVFAALVVTPLALLDPHRPLFFLFGAVQRHQEGMAAAGDVSAAELLSAAVLKVARHARMWLWSGDSNDLLSEEMGIVGPAVAAAALVGLGCAAAGARRSGFDLFLVAATAVEVMLGGALVEFPARYRLVPVAVLSCLAAGRAVEAVRRRVRQPPVLWAVLSIVALCVTAGWELHRLQVAARDDRVLGEFYSIDFILARQIRSLQARFPTLPVLLFSDREYLGVPNDFSVVYDPERVRVVPPGKPAPPGDAVLLAHDEHIARARAVPGTVRCREWSTRYRRNRLLACRRFSRLPPELRDRS